MEPDDDGFELCPECEGEGEVDGDPCGYQDAIWDGVAHVVPHPVADPVIETGGGEIRETLESNTDFTQRSVNLADLALDAGVVRDPDSGEPLGVMVVDVQDRLPEVKDPVGCVVRGDNDGLAQRLNRFFGGGDAPFDGAAFDRFLARKAEFPELDDYPDAMVGKNWALVLDDLQIGSTGFSVQALCRLFGVPVRSELTPQVAYDVLKVMHPEIEPTPEELACFDFDTFNWFAHLP